MPTVHSRNHKDTNYGLILALYVNCLLIIINVYYEQYGYLRVVQHKDKRSGLILALYVKCLLIIVNVYYDQH